MEEVKRSVPTPRALRVTAAAATAAGLALALLAGTSLLLALRRRSR